MRKALVLGVALAALGAPLGSTADEARAPDGWRAPGEPARAAAARLMAALGEDGLTAPTWDELQRALLTAPEAAGGSELVPLGQPGDRPYTYPLAAADLTGDGAHELLVGIAPRAVRPDAAVEPFVLSVRGGMDMTERWRVGVSALGGFVGAMELTGDGAREVVVLDRIGLAQRSLGPTAAHAGIVDQRLRVFSGDGALLWSKSYPSTVVFAEPYSDSAEPEIAMLTRSIVSVLPVARAAGARPGLFVGTLSLDEAGSTSAPPLQRRTVSVRTTRFEGEVLRGDDGTALGGARADGLMAVDCFASCAALGGVSWIVPAATDAQVSLVLASFELAAGLIEVRALDGGVRWRRVVGTGVALPVSAPFAGPGGDDVLLVEHDLPSYDITLTLLDGEHGVRAWRTDARITSYDLLGDVDGDGGTDLLVDGEALRAISGRTTSVLWADPVLSAPAGQWDRASVGICACEDVTGDGVTDLVSFGRTWSGPSPDIAWTAAHDGVTGLALWEPVPLAYEAEIYLSRGDHDGDGARDLLAVVDEHDPHALRATPIGGPTGIALPSSAVPLTDRTFDESYWWYVLPIGADLAGDGIDELTLGVGEEGIDAEEPAYSRLDLFVHSTGELVWSSTA